MKLPNKLTQITKLSKTLALFLFILLPFIGFAAGVKYASFFSSIRESKLINDETKDCQKIISKVIKREEVAKSETNVNETVPTGSTNSGYTSADLRKLLNYENKEYEFEFQYPSIFINKETIRDKLEDYTGNKILVDLTTQNVGNKISADFNPVDIKLRVSLDSSAFSLDYLEKYEPTGYEGIRPEAKVFGVNTFHYYGAGGGGVCYPDQYFYNLNGKVLIFNFAGGCYMDKTPSEITKTIEKQMLTSFSLLD